LLKALEGWYGIRIVVEVAVEALATVMDEKTSGKSHWPIFIMPQNIVPGKLKSMGEHDQ
jgi:hypothetical protein